MDVETLLALATALVLGTAPAEIGRADHLVLGTAPAEVGRTDLLVLHSDPWINLHHFLYQWARDEAGVASGREYVDVRERTELGTLPADDRRIWEQAVAFYVQNLPSTGTSTTGCGPSRPACSNWPSVRTPPLPT